MRTTKGDFLYATTAIHYKKERKANSAQEREKETDCEEAEGKEREEA
jgi:hypothetical protein